MRRNQVFELNETALILGVLAMFFSYHVPPDFEQEWHSIGEVMERYFAHHQAAKTQAAAKSQTTVIAKVATPENPFLESMLRVALIVLVGGAMLCTLCYFMSLDREHALGLKKEPPKLELKTDFFAQPAYALDQNQTNKTQLQSSSLSSHYTPAFGLPRRFGCND
ncbi:hypothetical protein KA183_12955 [bacterium]|nr:hypothetical protein [bacterium]QQR57161.1 MAG: hypothetical protein IPG59_19585 [Candidatus Melainabacteria bacterium]